MKVGGHRPRPPRRWMGLSGLGGAGKEAGPLCRS